MIFSVSRFSCFVVVAVLLSACGTSQPVTYYNMDAINPVYTRDSVNAILLGVGPLRTPDYLERTRIVTRSGDGEVFVDDFNRWSESVEEAVYRIVSATLDGLLDDVVVIAFPYSYVAELSYQLLGRIDRFDADENGRVVLLVQWTVVDINGDVVVLPTRAKYEAQAAGGRDYASIARAMSEALDEFSRDVATEFEAATSSVDP